MNIEKGVFPALELRWQFHKESYPEPEKMLKTFGTTTANEIKEQHTKDLMDLR